MMIDPETLETKSEGRHGDVLPNALNHQLLSNIPTRMDQWALSSETSLVREIYAHAATGGQCSFEDLERRVQNGQLDRIDPEVLARMARVLALQANNLQDDGFAINALRLALDHLPNTRGTVHYRRLLAEVLFEHGEYSEFRSRVSQDPHLSADYWGYLVADSLNPYVVGRHINHETWLEVFNQPFVGNSMAPVQVEPASTTPFDTLEAPVSEVHPEGPLVSVILTTFNPDPTELATSLRSILNQTWRNLEVLLIDDCSTATEPALLENLAAQDDRIRVIRRQRNGGTYRARNAGLREARGQFVTGQDTDDWSHPERLARQVEYLADRPDLAGVMTRATRVDNRLARIVRGIDPDRRCEVSLLIRREDALAVGGYLPVRKAGDTEFRERLELWSGKPVDVIGQPLYMIRLSTGSLSRSDFRAGWSHPMRRGFRNAFGFWHATATRAELMVDNLHGQERLPFSVPPNMLGKEYTPQRFDLCFVADWRRHSPEVRSGLDEIRASITGGLSVSVLQLDSPYGGLRTGTPLVSDLQMMINAGDVAQIYAHGSDSVRTVIVRDPSVVHLGQRIFHGIDVERVLMVGQEDLESVAEELQTYDPVYAHHMAEDIFGTTVEWTLACGDALKDFADTFDVPVMDTPYPLVVDERRIVRRPLPAADGSGPVVIGRGTGVGPADWPADPEEMSMVYPVDSAADIRVVGDQHVVLDRLDANVLPASWIAFADDEIDRLVFWRTADFMVQFDGRARSRGHDRDMLEAMAAGTVIVSDRGYGRMYGEHVHTATADSVADTVARLRSDPEEYMRLAAAAQDYVRQRFTGAGFARFVKHYVGSGSEEVMSR